MKIKNNKEYKEALHKVCKLINKGDENLVDAEASQIERLIKAIEYYENHTLRIMPLPVTDASSHRYKMKNIVAIL